MLRFQIKMEFRNADYSGGRKIKETERITHQYRIKQNMITIQIQYLNPGHVGGGTRSHSFASIGESKISEIQLSRCIK